MGKTLIEVQEHNLDYYRQETSSIQTSKGFELLAFTFFFMIVSVIFALLQYYNYEPLAQLDKFKRIKRNMGTFRINILEKTAIETTRGKRIALSINDPSIYQFECLDFGSYFSPMRLNSSTYLPEFIRRGTGDVWKINKALKDGVTKDTSAEQFCQYVILNHSNETLTCGIDMYDELGYGGYFNTNHPCQSALDVLLETKE